MVICNNDDEDDDEENKQDVNVLNLYSKLSFD